MARTPRQIGRGGVVESLTQPRQVWQGVRRQCRLILFGQQQVEHAVPMLRQPGLRQRCEAAFEQGHISRAFLPCLHHRFAADGLTALASGPLGVEGNLKAATGSDAHLRHERLVHCKRLRPIALQAGHLGMLDFGDEGHGFVLRQHQTLSELHAKRLFELSAQTCFTRYIPARDRATDVMHASEVDAGHRRIAVDQRRQYFESPIVHLRYPAANAARCRPLREASCRRHPQAKSFLSFGSTSVTKWAMSCCP